MHRVACELGLDGEVSNDSEGVLIEAEGDPEALATLAARLRDGAPPLARVTGVRADDMAPTGPAGGFSIVTTRGEGTADVPVSIDVGPCHDCLSELTDPANRRYRHPFINCTNCGPRYTITRRIPYDRAQTTMAPFVMCSACQAEYDDPLDRRFHAQPNACPDCGPTLSLRTADGHPRAGRDAALAGAVADLQAGLVVALKGVGGFHLAADATNDDAVAVLRHRKHRDDKPFALLVADLSAAHELVHLDEVAAAALASPRRPIVLAPRRSPKAIAAGVAPGHPELGVMLPPSPLHVLLATDMGRPLVLTSGNVSHEPIVYADADVEARLGDLVDAVLTHDRAIHVRCDDSVARCGMGTNDGAPRLQVARRSRGHAPEPLVLPRPTHRHLLAVGAELKNTVAVAKQDRVVVSHHIGDLEHHAASIAFREAIDHLLHLYGVTPELVVHDLHPEYLSSKFAEDLDLPQIGVQHHHAHVAACLAEHGRTDRVLGIAYDGLGWGPDGTLWGGELLACDLDGYERLGHLATVALPGGAAAIREPWRMALAWLDRAQNRDRALAFGRRVDDRARAVVGLLDGDRSLATSSVGRLFDAVAALVGLRTSITYEGQAAIALEAAARTVPPSQAPCWPVELQAGDGGPAILDPAPLVRAVVAAVDQGVDPAVVAAGFHAGLARGTAELARDLAAQHDLAAVALSGGVFQNRRLTTLVEEQLSAIGLEVLVHEVTTPNDGSISLGQAAIAAR